MPPPPSALPRPARGALPARRRHEQPSRERATEPVRRRVPAAERREELIAAAVHEFAHGGLHGTPVERIARRVGVAQPYVFSLFATKRELFLAALERSFERVADTFRARRRATTRLGARRRSCEDALQAMGLRLQGAARVRSRLPDAPAPVLRRLRRRGRARVRAPPLRRAGRSSPASCPAPRPSDWTTSSATAWPSTSRPRSASRTCRSTAPGSRPSARRRRCG